MRKLLNVVLILLIVALGAGYFVLGPSVVLGGPTKAQIERVTREIMVLAAASPEEDAAATSAEITPQGLCSRSGEGVYACMVEITVEGSAPKTLITELMKGADGNWTAAP